MLLPPEQAQARDDWIESKLVAIAGQQRLKSRPYLDNDLKMEEQQPHKPQRPANFRLYLRDRSIALRVKSRKARTPMLDIPFNAQAGLLRLDRVSAYVVSTPAQQRAVEADRCVPGPWLACRPGSCHSGVSFRTRSCCSIAAP